MKVKEGNGEIMFESKKEQKKKNRQGEDTEREEERLVKIL